MQLKFQRVMAKPATGPQQKSYSHCVWLLSHLFLPIGYIALLLYALVWEAGNIISLPTKRIGFYNFCLWNQKAEELDCLSFKDLEKVGISTVALVLSRVFVYSTPVLCLFIATTALQALWLKDKDGWKLVRNLLIIGHSVLPFGLGLFCYQTWKWIHVLEFGEVFAALVGAEVLMFLHTTVTTVYLALFIDTLSPKKLFPQEGPLMII